MYYDILEAHYVDGYKIHLSFANGKTGVADLEKFTRRPGILAKLGDLDYFKKFHLDAELKVLTWEGEVDIAPEPLYHEATGEPLPAWMEEVQEEKHRALG